MPNGQALQPALDDRLVLTTLGRAALECVTDSGERRELLTAGKPLGLLIYLASSPGHSASREHLVDLLWADQDVEAAKHSVRQAIWYLRQRLGEHAIAATDGAVKLCAAVESDRDAFLNAIERVEFERALVVYRGNFLPGFAAPGGADFEQWADLERFRLRRLFQRAGETVARVWLAKGRLRKAKELAARVRDADPEDESGWRLVLESLLAATDRVDAELEAHRLEARLAHAARPPEPATAALLALVRQAPTESSSAPSRPPLTAELIGREHEFAAILSAWDAVRGGSGRHVHITGAAGLGKSRLLADVQARLRAAGARVVAVRANPGERTVTCALVSDLAAAAAALPGAAAVSPGSAAALVGLNPTLSSRYDTPPDRASDLDALRRREIALAELLAAVADEHPLAVMIDDVHWADGVSRQLLGHLLSRALTRPLLVVTTARPGPEGIAGPEFAKPLVLSPLAVSDIGALLASLGRLPDEPWAARLPEALHSTTRGTPLLILETLHLLTERAALTLEQGNWRCADPAALAAELARGGALGRRIEELERGPRWLLLLLAEAGTPLAGRVLAQAAGRDPEAAQADLLALEVRGLATRDGAEWEPAHDEIAARAMELAAPEALRAGNAVLGRQLASTGRHDPDVLHRAARHFAAAGDERELCRVFTRRLLLQRRRGERRSPTALAADLLGQEAAHDRVKRLVRTLPLHVRLGLTTSGRIAAALVGGLVVAGAGSFPLWRPAPAQPDAMLIVLTPLGGESLAAMAAPLRRREWAAGGSIPLRGYPVLASSGGRVGHSASPDGKQWAFSRLVDDSGEIELFLVGADGHPRRLTHSRGSDANPEWSPDGRFLAFATDRWNIASRRTDIASIDVATGRVRRLTDAGTSTGGPHWSPDGTRIAFTAQPRQRARTSLCWTTPAGGSSNCLSLTFNQAWIVGWYDDSRLLVLTGTAGETLLERVNLDAEDKELIARERGAMYVSPDGRWVACYCVRPGFQESRWFAYPTDAPLVVRPLALRDYRSATSAAWTLPAGRTFVERLEIHAPSDSVTLGLPFRLRAQGLDPSGNPLALHALSWRSDDDDIASVGESSGVVLARRAGAFTAHLTVGGWREAARRFVVVPAGDSLVLTEDWSDSIERHWVPFGDPRPEIVVGPQAHRAFWNHGDGWYLSGAYSRAAFSARGGIALEVELSTPVIGPRQQFVNVSLYWWQDSTALLRWGRHLGGAPEPAGSCEYHYPLGGGDQDSDRGWIPFGGRVFAAPPRVTAGAWHTVRVQIFPDGRCGLALDGTPVWIADDPVATNRPYRVVLHGNSLGNRMLVGAVKVWEGVPNDVDWTSLDHQP